MNEWKEKKREKSSAGTLILTSSCIENSRVSQTQRWLAVWMIRTWISEALCSMVEARTSTVQLPSSFHCSSFERLCLSFFPGVPSKPQLSGFEEPVREGASITLTCSSTGSKPPAKLHWYREDQELPGEIGISSNDEHVLLKVFCWAFPKQNKHASSVYFCPSFPICYH